MSRCKTSDAFVLFSARYHSSQNGDVKWLPLSILYVFKNEMGCADAFRCLMGDTSVKVLLHALRCHYSKSILFLLLINGKYFLRATSERREEDRSWGLLAKPSTAGSASWSSEAGFFIPWRMCKGGSSCEPLAFACAAWHTGGSGDIPAPLSPFSYGLLHHPRRPLSVLSPR